MLNPHTFSGEPKIGASSYMVTILNLQPGEYGVTTADFTHISTFSVQ